MIIWIMSRRIIFSRCPFWIGYLNEVSCSCWIIRWIRKRRRRLVALWSYLYLRNLRDWLWWTTIWSTKTLLLFSNLFRAFKTVVSQVWHSSKTKLETSRSRAWQIISLPVMQSYFWKSSISKIQLSWAKICRWKVSFFRCRRKHRIWRPSRLWAFHK